MKPARIMNALLLNWLVYMGGLTTAVHAATLTVDRFDDDGCATACSDMPGDCPLRGAVNAAQKGDIIILPAGSYTLGPGCDDMYDYMVDTGDITITKDLTITGAGEATTSISWPLPPPGVEFPPSRDRIFDIFTPTGDAASALPIIDISGVTIQNGVALGDGGGIRNAGRLFLTNVIITGNQATSRETSPGLVNAKGGGVFNSGFVTLRNVIIRDNTAIDGGGLANIGGTLRLEENTIVDSNVASGDTINRAETSVGRGGGIFNFIVEGTSDFPTSRAVLELDNSVVRNNSAGNVLMVGSEVSIVRGVGGGVFNGEGTVTLSNHSTVSDNRTLGDGGGVFNAFSEFVNDDPLFGLITVTNSTVSGNRAGDIIDTDTAPILVPGNGGGVANESNSLVLIESSVTDNTVEANGGGISNRGTVTLVRSTVSNNEAGSDGGGVHNLATAIVTNSTISTNAAHRHGGGVVTGVGEMTLSNVTIVDNAANREGNDRGEGGGIYHITGEGAGSVRMQHTIIARNVATPRNPDCFGFFSALALNLIQNLTSECLFDSPNQVLIADPNLGPLDNNGGLTLTHALQVPSPAIDAGSPDGCTDEQGVELTTDQRNGDRPLDGDVDGESSCDLGSYERLTPSANLAIVKTGAPDPTILGDNVTYTLTVTNSGPFAANNVTVTDILPVDVVPVTASSSQGTCSPGCVTNCALGTINSGAVATMTIEIRPTRVGTIANTAMVSGLEPDPDRSNNTTPEFRSTVLAPAQLPSASRTLRPVADFPENPRLAYVLIGTPLNLITTDPLTLFSGPLGPLGANSWRMFRFESDPTELPELGRYREFEEGDDSFSLIPGRSYWLIARNGGTVTVTGDPLDAARPFDIQLDPGPQQIATPLNFPAGITLDWAGCISERLPEGVDNALVDFDGTIGGYREVSTMEPIHGYWVFNHNSEPVTLSIPPECIRQFVAGACVSAGATLLNTTSTQQSTRFFSGWKAQLSAAVGSTDDAENYFGVDTAGKDGYDVLDHTEPPPVHGLSLSFSHPEWQGSWPYYATDIRGFANNGPQVWDFTINTDVRNADVQLRWNLKGIDGKALTLRDVETGRTVNMGETKRYSYKNKRQKTHHFQVTAR
jgi:uncharacterized repeat protein (TIGR01451 family)